MVYTFVYVMSSPESVEGNRSDAVSHALFRAKDKGLRKQFEICVANMDYNGS